MIMRTSCRLLKAAKRRDILLLGGVYKSLLLLSATAETSIVRRSRFQEIARVSAIDHSLLLDHTSGTTYIFT